jgi:hypothetical protein
MYSGKDHTNQGDDDQHNGKQAHQGFTLILLQLKQAKRNQQQE